MAVVLLGEVVALKDLVIETPPEVWLQRSTAEMQADAQKRLEEIAAKMLRERGFAETKAFFDALPALINGRK